MSVNTSERLDAQRGTLSHQSLTRFHWAPGIFYHHHHHRHRHRHRFPCPAIAVLYCTVLSCGINPIIFSAYLHPLFFKQIVVSLHFSSTNPPVQCTTIRASRFIYIYNIGNRTLLFVIFFFFDRVFINVLILSMVPIFCNVYNHWYLLPLQLT